MLPDPKTPFQKLVRRLAVTGQEALYHDIGDYMPEYWSGVETLERLFTPILRNARRAKYPPKPKRTVIKSAGRFAPDWSGPDGV